MAEEDNEEYQQALRKSNKEVWQEWAIDVHADPYQMPLEKLNPAHPSLFGTHVGGGADDSAAHRVLAAH